MTVKKMIEELKKLHGDSIVKAFPEKIIGLFEYEVGGKKYVSFQVKKYED